MHILCPPIANSHHTEENNMTQTMTVRDALNNLTDKMNECARFNIGCNDNIVTTTDVSWMQYLTDWRVLAVGLPVVIICLFFLSSMFVLTKEKEASVIMSWFGTKFNSIRKTGLGLKLPWPLYTVQEKVSLKQFEIEEELQIKTKDNAYVDLPVSVQVRRLENKIYEAVFSLEDPLDQISSYILKAVKNAAGDLDLEELYTDKNQIKDSVIENLQKDLQNYGFEIIDVLVDEPIPSEEVQAEYNSIVAAQKSKVAAEHKGEAQKIVATKNAKAEEISMKGKGEATVAMRREYTKGLKEDMEQLRVAFPELDDQAINGILERIDLRDTLRDVGEHGGVVVANVNGDGNKTDDSKTIAMINALMAQQKKEETKES